MNQRRERKKQQCKGVDKVILRESHRKETECNCGMCLSCGGWAAPWKPEWWQHLDTWLASLSTPCLETDSEAETLSTVCTLEVDSEWGDQLDALLATKSDSEVETVSVPSVAPSRRSARIAARPPVCYGNPMPEVLERKIELHEQGVERIVTRWETMWARTHAVDSIMEDMGPMDPARQLDRFHA